MRVLPLAEHFPLDGKQRGLLGEQHSEVAPCPALPYFDPV